MFSNSCVVVTSFAVCNACTISWNLIDDGHVANRQVNANGVADMCWMWIYTAGMRKRERERENLTVCVPVLGALCSSVLLDGRSGARQRLVTTNQLMN